ncbi:MAG: CDP-alcohol phosphatidyltransferase family protein [Flavobacteriaceae bacterium]
MKKHIPNFITLLNLLSGLIAVILALKGELTLASLFILLGILFDFFDGFAARLLNVSGELGKQLDSLADLVTSGVAPAMIMYKLLSQSQSHTNWYQDFSCTIGSWASEHNNTIYFFPFIGMLLAIAAAYRLANFNIDERQTSSFIGLPTPAMSLFIAAIPLILMYSNNVLAKNVFLNKYVLIGITIILSLLMNANISLFSLKFKNYSFKDNAFVYLFLIASLLLLLIFKFVAIPIIITIYVVFSLVQNNFKKQ